MSTQDYLRVQVRLLVAQFGRRAALEALAAASEASPEQIQDAIARLEANKKAKTAKHPKSLDERLAALSPLPDEQRDIVRSLGRLYESKQFLPNLRDAEEFLRRSGAPPKRHKSRMGALASVLDVLSSMSQPDLEGLLVDITRSQEQSDYAILAEQLMGKSH